MFKTLSLREEKLRRQFIPDDVLGVVWNWVNFDSTYKVTVKKIDVEQALLNLPATRNDSGSF